MTRTRQSRPLIPLLAMLWIAAMAPGEPTTAPSPKTHPNISPAAMPALRTEKYATTWTALSAVGDNTATPNEPAFYMLLKLIADQEPLDAAARKALYVPPHESMVATPQSYRGQAIRLQVSVSVVKKLIPGVDSEEFPFKPKYWTKGKPIWRLYGVLLGPDEVPDKDQPIVVYSTADPKDLLRGKAKPNRHGASEYGAGQYMEVAGLFFKLIRQERRDEDGKEQSYPVILAWQLDRIERPQDKKAMDMMASIVIAICVVAGILMFLFLKRYLKRQKQVELHERQYRSLRGEAREPAIEAPRDDPDVDPDLKTAAEEYLKEKERRATEDAGDDTG